ncbi:MAG: ArnT family glycosyltransferase [Thermoflexales bacterium]
MRLERAPITTILLTALILRVWAVDHHLPYIYHHDEPFYIKISQNIFKTADLNPHFFNYPSLFFYINALAYVPYYIIGNLVGVFQSPYDILQPFILAGGATHAQMPTVVLLGRIVTICFGVGTVGMVYLIGRQLTGATRMGLLAAWFVAISPANVWHSRLITPDTFVTFFASASLLTSILVYQQGKTWQYVLAGLFVGFTASSKYNGALVLLPLLLAHFLRFGRTAFKQPKLYLALLLCGVGFVATTPYALLDSAKFLADLSYEARHYSTGHAGMEGNTLRWYLTHMWETGKWLYLLAACGILCGFVVRPKETLLLSAFPVAYFAFINSFVVRNDRTFLPLTPFLFLLAAWFLIVLLDWLEKSPLQALRRSYWAALIILTVALSAFPISKTVADTRRLLTVDSRATARIWIDSNLPPGSKIAIESYAPFINPSKFEVHVFGRMTEHPPEWYIEQGFDYLIFSQGMYGRFYREPDRYADEKRRYDNLFNYFIAERIFSDGGYEVRIYRAK